MRPVSAECADTLLDSFDVTYVADVVLGASRRLQDVPIVDPQIDWSVDREIIGNASVTVAYTPEYAESVTPRKLGDALSPFGAELILSMVISAGSYSERVQLGRFVISSVPEGQDSYHSFMNRTLPAGSVVDLVLQDQSLRVKRNGFHYPEQPPSLSSAFNELARITGLQVVRNVPDKAIPTSIVYEASQGGRLKGAEDLCTVLGGILYVNSYGAVTVLPDAWPEPTQALRLGDQSTILTVGHSMDSEGIYNEVVGSFEAEDRTPIYATAQILDGPLSVNGPLGHLTYYMSSPIVKTQGAADAAVSTRLANLSTQRTHRVPVDCIVDPRIEVGDVILVEQPTENIVGRVASVSISDDSGKMHVDLEVPG